MHSPTSRILTILLCILSASSFSCKKFLSTYSQNKSFIESAADLDELLVGEGYSPYSTQFLFTMDDDAQVGKPTYGQPWERGFHFWQAEPRINELDVLSVKDDFFNGIYSSIARINTILLNVTLLRDKGEPAIALSRISGEAHFLRAFYYFMLVNTYGKPYKPSTASVDFGVPLKTDPAVKDQFASRSSNAQVYEQILADLLEAEKELAGTNQSSTIRANQAAAQALLSRVYLFMENYEMAVLYANKVINTQKYQLTDLNNHTPGKDFLKLQSPEVVFSMGGNKIYELMALQSNRAIYKVSDDLALSFSPEDLRRQLFLVQNSEGEIRLTKKPTSDGINSDDVSSTFLLRLSELYLNKAEALAALDRFPEARTTLQDLRKKRFKPAELPAVNSEGAILMNTIREERRRELCFEAHRWFDLRRYGVNTKYPFSKTIRHDAIVLTGGRWEPSGYYELKPYEQDAAAYIVPIAGDEIEFNKGLLTNEQRPERPWKQ